MSEFIYGKNTVRAAIEANKDLKNLYIQDNNTELIRLAKDHKLKFKVVDNKFLNDLVKGVHQGIIAEVESYKYYTVDEILQTQNKYPLIIILDGLEDPHNLGAILRTSDAAGVDGVIIPKNRSVGLNSTVAKVSTGAIEHVKVSEVTNLTATIKYLKEKGYWIVGAEATNKSQDFRKVKYDMPTVLVVGSEGKGISRLVLEQCDFLVKIPMYGHVNSLNASVSCSILIYEIIKYREG